MRLHLLIQLSFKKFKFNLLYIFENIQLSFFFGFYTFRLPLNKHFYLLIVFFVPYLLTVNTVVRLHFAHLNFFFLGLLGGGTHLCGVGVGIWSSAPRIEHGPLLSSGCTVAKAHCLLPTV